MVQRGRYYNHHHHSHVDMLDQSLMNFSGEEIFHIIYHNYTLTNDYKPDNAYCIFSLFSLENQTIN